MCIDFSAINLRPGVVVHFTAQRAGNNSVSSDAFITRLRISSLRHGLDFKEMPPPAPQLDDVVVSRLYNIGNLRSNSYIYFPAGRDCANRGTYLEEFFDTIIDFPSFVSGSVDATSLITSYPHPLCRGAMSPPTPNGSTPDYDCQCSCGKYATAMPAAPIPREKTPEEIEEDLFDIEIESLQSAQRDILRRIGILVTQYVKEYHRMPDIDKLLGHIKGKFLIDSDSYSPVKVNGNMQLILPDYDEMQLRLTPLCRALYILFLCHPDGIVLKEIDRYRHQFEEIYYMVKPGVSDSLARASVDDICRPASESLLQKISRIKSDVTKQLVNPSLAERYCISGMRGGAYSIPAAAHCSLPCCLAKG